LEREVAVKVLPGGDLAGSEARERLAQEAKATARLKHPNIVTIHEVGEDEGLPYLVMEMIEGGTLGQALTERVVPVRQLARWLREVAAAVQHAHAQGVLHRDLKPSNILIEPWDDGGRPRVTDFGLAKLMDADTELTRSGAAAGSPGFMAPEQARGSAATPASDVYGLGAVLYYALTGRAPFQGETVASVLAQVERDDPLPPQRLSGSVPRDLETICLKALEKNPARRYASAAALSDDLTRFLEHQPVQARPLGPLARSGRWARRRPWEAAAAGLVALLLAGGFFFLAWRAQTDRRHSDELASEQRATRLALLQSQLGEARSLLRLRLPDSRLRIEAMMDAVLSQPWSSDLIRDARSLRVAAQALPRAELLALRGEGTADDDWTMALGDLSRGRWAQAGFRGPVTLRKIDDGAALSSFPIGDRQVTALISISPGGRWLAIRHLDELGVWDTTNGTLVFAAPAWNETRRFGFMHVAFTADDERVLWSDPNNVVLTALPEGRELARWPTAAGALALSPDGRTLAIALLNEPRVELRDWPGGALIGAHESRFAHALCALALSPDGQRLAGGDSAGHIMVWPVAGVGESIEVAGHREGLRAVQFSGDGHRLVSTGEDATLRLWDVALGEEMLALPLEAGVVSEFGDRLGVGVHKGHRHLLHWKPPAVLKRWTPPARPSVPQQVAWGDAGRHLLMLQAQGALAWNSHDGTVAREYPLPFSLSVLRETQETAGVLVGGKSGLVRFAHGETTEIFPATPWGWDVLTASADGRWFAASDHARTSVALWPAGDASSARAKFLALKEAGPGQLALSPDGGKAAVTHRYHPGLLLFDTATGQITHRLELPSRHGLAWSPDGRWLAASGTSHLMWDTTTWQQVSLPALAPNHAPAGGVGFAPNGNVLAVTTGSSTIALICLPERQHVLTLTAPGERSLYQLAFSPDGRWLAAGAARGEVHVWDVVAVTADSPVR
ncbi:MAG: WD40 repeat domain-containing serine/threonine protein kinase, partial [Verrucomicrobiales bacterium]